MNERRVVWLVALVQLINILDFMIVMPLGPDFAKALGFAESNTGLIGSSYTFAAAISGLIAARFLDRFDRRTALAWSLLGLAVGTALGGLATGLPSLIVARVVAGIFGGPAASLSLAIIADVVPPERRGRAMAIVMAGFSVATVLGVPMGLVLARMGSWSTPFFAIAGLGLVIAAVTAFALPPLRLHLENVPTHPTRAVDLLRRPEIALSLVATSLLMISVFGLVPNISAYIQHNLGYPRDELEILYLAAGVISFGVLQLAGRSVDRFGAVPVAWLGAIVLTIGCWTGFASEPARLPVMAVYVLFMCSGTLRSVAIGALTSRLPAMHERAQFMSLQSVVQHLSAAGAALLASQILWTRSDGRLVRVDLIAIGSIVTALLVPVLLWRVQLRIDRAAAAVAPPAPAPVAAAS